MILPTPVNEVIPLYSFDEWRNRGYVVLKGEKSSGRTSDGLPGFSEAQVKRGGADISQQLRSRELRIDTIGQPSRTIQIDKQGNEILDSRPAVNQYLRTNHYQYYVPPERTRPVPIINPANAIELGSGIRFVNDDIERLQRQAHSPIVNTDVEDAAVMAYFNQMLLSGEAPPVKIAKKAKTKKEEPEEHVLSNKRKIDI